MPTNVIGKKRLFVLMVAGTVLGGLTAAGAEILHGANPARIDSDARLPQAGEVLLVTTDSGEAVYVNDPARHSTTVTAGYRIPVFSASAPGSSLEPAVLAAAD